MHRVSTTASMKFTQNKYIMHRVWVSIILLCCQTKVFVVFSFVVFAGWIQPIISSLKFSFARFLMAFMLLADFIFGSRIAISFRMTPAPCNPKFKLDMTRSTGVFQLWCGVVWTDTSISRSCWRKKAIFANWVLANLILWSGPPSW